jgi:predicted RNase H-like nuclease (RuvC/YqgF family)
MLDINNINANPFEAEVPVPQFVTRAGDRSGRTADHAAWLKDIEERKARAAEFEAKRQQVKPKELKVELSAIDDVLNALDAAAEEFEQSYAKPNQPLIDAKIEVDRRRRDLAEAEARLTELGAKGDSIQRLKNAITVAEAQLLELRSTAESEEILRLAAEHYGWEIPWNRIGDEMKRDFRNHASVLAFKKFFLLASHNVTDPAELRQRLELVGEKLVALKEHFETCVETPGFDP